MKCVQVKVYGPPEQFDQNDLKLFQRVLIREMDGVLRLCHWFKNRETHTKWNYHAKTPRGSV